MQSSKAESTFILSPGGIPSAKLPNNECIRDTHVPLHSSRRMLHRPSAIYHLKLPTVLQSLSAQAMSAQASSQASRKSFLPLESNPAVFTELIHALGVSEKLVFHDVYSISDPDLLALVPRPVYALVLVTPAFPEHDAAKAAEEQVREEYTGFGEDEPVVWFKQTIHNACGLYAILHAICNGVPRSYIGGGLSNA